MFRAFALCHYPALEMMTASARKTSFQNTHLRNCEYFVIFPSCSHSTMLAKYATTGVVCAPVKVTTENQRFPIVCSSCLQNWKCGIFLHCCSKEDGTDLFIRAWSSVQHDYFSTFDQLRVTDSKYRESLDRFEKSKTLKLCLKNAFRELSLKMLLRFSKS